MEPQLPHSSPACAARIAVLSQRVDIPRDTDLEPRRCHRPEIENEVLGDENSVLEDCGGLYRGGRSSSKCSMVSVCASDSHEGSSRIKYKRIPRTIKEARHTVSFLTRSRTFKGGLDVLEEDRLSEPWRFDECEQKDAMDEGAAGSDDFGVLSNEVVQSPTRFSPKAPSDLSQKVKKLSGSDWRAKFDKTARERLSRRRKAHRRRQELQDSEFDRQESQDSDAPMQRRVSDPGPECTTEGYFPEGEGARPPSPKTAKAVGYNPWSQPGC